MPSAIVFLFALLVPVGAFHGPPSAIAASRKASSVSMAGSPWFDPSAQSMKAWLTKSSAKDNGREERIVEEEPIYSTSRRMRDEKLAQKDTRAFCLDRCLATGYCDVLEDLLEMTTKQVQRFCDECAGDDECLLPEYA